MRRNKHQNRQLPYSLVTDPMDGDSRVDQLRDLDETSAGSEAALQVAGESVAHLRDAIVYVGNAVAHLLPEEEAQPLLELLESSLGVADLLKANAEIQHAIIEGVIAMAREYKFQRDVKINEVIYEQRRNLDLPGFIADRLQLSREDAVRFLDAISGQSDIWVSDFSLSDVRELALQIVAQVVEEETFRAQVEADLAEESYDD